LARDLSEPFGDESRFEARNFASFVALYVEHPFALDSLAAGGEFINFLIDAFGFKRREFLLHCREPFSPV
jgi:hypothetical protein